MSFDELRWILSSRGSPLMKTTRLMMDKLKTKWYSICKSVAVTLWLSSHVKTLDAVQPVGILELKAAL